MERRGGRVSAPPVTHDPFSKPAQWAAWPDDNWAADDAWARDKTDSVDKNDSWGFDANRNLDTTWPVATLPAKKEKSPRPVKYAKSLVHTIGGIGRAKRKEEKRAGARAPEPLPSEEQQWAWAAAESRRLQQEAELRRRREDADLQMALAISRQDQ